jgi:glycosyltransferase involved in cell wall biosynthesis
MRHSTARVKAAHITTVDMSLRYLLLNQLHSIQQSGYEVIAISAPGPEAPVIEQAGIRHIAVPMTRNFTPLADLGSLMRLYGVMRRERFTIVHTHTPKAGLLGQLAARMAGVPIVINTLHGFYFHDHMAPAARRFYIQMERIAARCSDVLLSQNSEDIQTAIEEGICRPEKIKHLGNGINLALFDRTQISHLALQQKRAELGIPDSAQVVGFVGRLAARRKGFLDFLAAGRKLVRQLPNIWFLIVGDADHGKPDAVSPDAARDYGIAERCIFLGQRPNAQLPSLYALMDVLVLPSLFEGVPRVVMEASALCVPVVASDVKGNREAVIHGGNGRLTPWGDVAAITSALFAILSAPDQARRMGAAGRQMAIERFDERLVFQRIKAEYSRILQEKGLSIDEPYAASKLLS